MHNYLRRLNYDIKPKIKLTATKYKRINPKRHNNFNENMKDKSIFLLENDILVGQRFTHVCFLLNLRILSSLRINSCLRVSDLNLEDIIFHSPFEDDVMLMVIIVVCLKSSLML